MQIYHCIDIVGSQHKYLGEIRNFDPVIITLITRMKPGVTPDILKNFCDI